MKEIIHNIFVIIGIIVASILGIFGQDISYYLNEQFPMIKLTTAITIVTFVSIGLYIIIPILSSISNRLQKLSFRICFIACFLLGFPISMWSFFVWGMWMH